MSLSTCWEIQYFVLLLHFQLSRDLIVFIISFISSFDIIITVMCDPKISFLIAAFVADAAAVNPNGITRLLANGFSTFFIKDKSIFNNVPESQPKLSPDCSILDNWVFDNFILTDEQFEKALRSLESCLLLTNNFYGKLFSLLELPVTLDEKFKVTSVSFFILDFILLSFELDNFTFKVLRFILKQIKITIPSQFLVKNLKWVLLFLQLWKSLLSLHLDLALNFL